MDTNDNPFKELEHKSALMASGATCIVYVFNDLPPQYGIKIGGGACQFFYQDDNGAETSSSVVYHQDIDIASGKILYFQSDKPQECVKEIRVSLKGVAPDGTTKPLNIISDLKPANQCWTVKEFHVGIPSSLDMLSIKKHVAENISLQDTQK